jgi:hypothetical protein
MGSRCSSWEATRAATPGPTAMSTWMCWSRRGHATSGQPGWTSRGLGWCASRCGFGMWRPGSPASSSPRAGRLGLPRWRPCGCAGSPTNRGEHAWSDPSWPTRLASRNWTTWLATWARWPTPGAEAMNLACGWLPRILPGPVRRCCNRSIRTPRLAAVTERCWRPWTLLLSARLPRRPVGLPGSCRPDDRRRGGPYRRVSPGDGRGRAAGVARGQGRGAAAPAAGGGPRRWQPTPVPRPTRQGPIPVRRRITMRV